MFNNRSRQQHPQDDPGIDSLKPYQDNLLDEENVKTLASSDKLLPSYEPMHDYLRRKNAHFMTTVEPSTLFRQLSDTAFLPPPIAYTDEPFLISLDDHPEALPPAYDNLHHQHEYELQSLQGFFMNGVDETITEEEDDQEEDPGLQFEDLVKWVLVMLMISLMVTFIGTLFG
ncbi:hypothetical protein OnM2_100023 [Erysiphe neolycopersici]|uniref:Uncharacterized protein n=1 Tax=Erysiphe neolycopersici TaxID=212602 RepID=A0A420H982_9PEZI|nr:hypothetical protein OnM2_100023 [Erysiphe neolycopersici]